MTALEKLAAALRDRGVGRKDASHCSRSEPSLTTSPIGYGSSTGPTIARLKEGLRSAHAEIARLRLELAVVKARAVTAESATLALQADLKETHGKRAALIVELQDLRAAAEEWVTPARRLLGAWKRIEVLEAQVERLRPEAKLRRDWQAIRLRLRALLLRHPKRGLISIRAAAAAVGVNAKAVDNWLRGICSPRPETQGGCHGLGEGDGSLFISSLTSRVPTSSSRRNL
jgi:hypothetical protein